MYRLPDLPYAYDALLPVISEDIMRLHHQKHHQGYVDKLNVALSSYEEFKDEPLVSMLSQLDKLPEAVRLAVRNQGGGHYNHSLFWQCMSPDASGAPTGLLAEAINSKWGGFDAFVEEFTAKALGLFGSGWVWLTRDLEIITLPNQDTPMMLGKGEPVMGLDVWEHAYYLDYHNRREEYVKNWWQVANWSYIGERFQHLSN